MATAAYFLWVTSQASGGDNLCSCEDLDNKMICGLLLTYSKIF